jgi:DNA adenine methylase
MQYMGGKNRIAKKIVAELRKYYIDGMTYIEPFVGGANVIAHVDFTDRRIAGDIDPQLIRMWEAVSNGWTPPLSLDEETYKRLKLEQPDDPVTGFAKYGCSFGGKAWGGYARNTNKRNYSGTAYRMVNKKASGLKDVSWYIGLYTDAPVTSNCLVYCDPPYAGTTDYKTNFDHTAFWNVIRDWSKDNVVLVSEYNAPDDFEAVWTLERKTNLRDTDNKRINATEKLFKWKTSDVTTLILDNDNEQE